MGRSNEVRRQKRGDGEKAFAKSAHHHRSGAVSGVVAGAHARAHGADEHHPENGSADPGPLSAGLVEDRDGFAFCLVRLDRVGHVVFRVRFVVAHVGIALLV